MITVDSDIELRWPTLDDAQPLFELIDANRQSFQRWMPFVPNVRTQDVEEVSTSTVEPSITLPQLASIEDIFRTLGV